MFTTAEPVTNGVCPWNGAKTHEKVNLHRLVSISTVVQLEARGGWVRLIKHCLEFPPKHTA